MDDLLGDFLAETGESLALLDAELVRLERRPDPELLQDIFRLFHTIKGTCGFLGLPRLEALAHAAEGVLDRGRNAANGATPEMAGLALEAIDRIKDLLRALEASGREPEGDDAPFLARLDRFAAGPAEPGAAAAEPGAATAAFPGPEPRIAAVRSLRVNVELVDGLIDLVGELVLARNELLQFLRATGERALPPPLQRLSQVTTEIQASVMKTRMQPVGHAWSKLPRLVRDLALDLGKTIDLELRGTEIELDRHVIELISDPLTHMVRNAADHGIEPPAERLRLGKQAAGRIVLSARQGGGRVVIDIEDDGRGFAVERIRERAAALGLAGPAELAAMSDRQAMQFAFHPGFSTAAAVTSISGRGVGLDVVRANLERIGGAVEIDSRKGEGTRFTISIPLTLAIVPALIVESGGERFALPQEAVLELVQAGAGSAHEIDYLGETPLLRLRGRLLPLVALDRLLRLDRGTPFGTALVAVVDIGECGFGIVVDRVFDAEEVVVKPVAAILRGIGVFAGHTILGDGSVVMILDPAGIATAAGATGGLEAVARPAQAERASLDRRESLLLVRAGPGAMKAIPLGAVARLEEIDLGAIERAAGCPAVQYRGRLLPLAALAPGADLAGEGLRPIVLLGEDGARVGLVVDEIADIVDASLEIERVSDLPGIVGSAVVAGRAVDIVDAGFYLRSACAGQAGATADMTHAPRGKRDAA